MLTNEFIGVTDSSFPSLRFKRTKISGYSNQRFLHFVVESMSSGDVRRADIMEFGRHNLNLLIQDIGSAQEWRAIGSNPVQS